MSNVACVVIVLSKNIDGQQQQEVTQLTLIACTHIGDGNVKRIACSSTSSCDEHLTVDTDSDSPGSSCAEVRNTMIRLGLL